MTASIAWPTASGSRFTQGQWSVYGVVPINDKTSAFVEYYGFGLNSKGTDAAHYADTGVFYLLTDTIQLDARVGFGLNQAADSLFAGFGISYLF